MTHLQFVALAYSITAVTITGLVIWLLAAKMRLQSRLRRLERQQAAQQKARTKAEV